MIVIFPMTGPIFFEGNDFHFPKPLIELHDKTLIEYAIDGFADIPDVEFRFVIKQDDDRRFQISSVIHQAVKGRPVKIFTVPDKTSGALCSALMALPDEGVAENQEVIISNYDQIFTIETSSLINGFYNSDLDFGLVSFDSIHPKWSYVETINGQVIKVQEKKVISNQATAGFFYFRNGSDFVSAAKNMILKRDHLNNNYYVSHTFNQLILINKKIVTNEVDSKNYFKLSTPDDIEAYRRLVEEK